MCQNISYLTLQGIPERMRRRLCFEILLEKKRRIIETQKSISPNLVQICSAFESMHACKKADIHNGPLVPTFLQGVSKMHEESSSEKFKLFLLSHLCLQTRWWHRVLLFNVM